MSEDSPVRGPNLGLLCFFPYRAMEARVMDALAEAGYDDITLAQSRVFQRVGPNGTRVTDLAEQARISKQTATFLVDQLERAGYVERVPDPVDARARLVRIAARGEACVAIARVVESEVEAEWTRHLGKRDADHLRRALTRLREVTDPYG
ncbi:MarR family winged helix-turn-helix transcriptional regulator [Planotetraspora phitsanulokensis]|uniref:MarR family transcriptional regulator n=1 Tax=Planotetraspora phitsanulokensis TaxID=575192 RepID=A0A8J3U484_9ACTN|nr:MarR family winged helix-turn-helix transcriptional regulator [Planotetraspora phitsanulokensis]GII37916.1 MarR family transcriptional regulator [Planotetraspora phitsanulokensis]